LTSKPKDPPIPPLPVGLATGESGLEPSGANDARERILRAAYDLFCRDGIAATGIDRIVAEAGVAKMSLYRHFASKDDLVRAVLDTRDDLWTKGWLEHEVERRSTTPVGRLLAVFDAFDDWFQREDYESCLFIRSLFETMGRDTPVFEAAASHLSNIRVLLRRLAEEAGARDPEAFAYELQMLMSGAIVLTTAGDAEAAGRARALARLLLDREGLRSEA
jgi:AcrR family transcriptional regulator